MMDNYNILRQLNSLYNKGKKINNRLYQLEIESKELKGNKKRAKRNGASLDGTDDSYIRIQEELKYLKKSAMRINTERAALEIIFLREELRSRNSKEHTITKIDHRYQAKFRSIFSKLHGFGDLNGYLKGRIEECSREIDEYFLKQIIDRYIEEQGGYSALAQQYHISMKKKHQIRKCALEDMFEQGFIDYNDLKNKRENFINDCEGEIVGTADRKKTLIKVIRHTPRNAPDTPDLSNLLDLTEEDAER